MKYPVHAAAVIALVAIVGIIAFNAFSPRLNAAGPGPTDRRDLTDSPTPASGSPSAAPYPPSAARDTPVPTPVSNPGCNPDAPYPDAVWAMGSGLGVLEPGTYVCYGLQAGVGAVNVQFTVPAGWEWHGSYLSKGLIGSRGDPAASSVEEARISFLGGDAQVYTDPCQWSGAEPDDLPTGPTVTDLIDALAAQPMRSASTPTERHAYAVGSDTTLPPSPDNGFEGMAIELTVPDDINLADCDGGQFRSWGPDPNVRAHQGPGQRDVVWVVTTCPENCLNYERLVIDASWMPATPADVVAEIEAILDSIATGHWG